MNLKEKLRFYSLIINIFLVNYREVFKEEVMKTRKIYILLTYSGTILSRLIKRYTREPYSHVSVSLDIDLDQLYSFGRKIPRNPLFAGFVEEDIINGTYARFPNTKCALYSVDISAESYENLLKELERFKESKDRYKYNLIGLLGYMMNRPIDREYRYFCSQFVSEVLNNSGVRLIDKPSNLTAPGDFRKCRDLDLVYEGDLKKYKDLTCQLAN